jgi:hypothetical protein
LYKKYRKHKDIADNILAAAKLAESTSLKDWGKNSVDLLEKLPTHRDAAAAIKANKRYRDIYDDDCSKNKEK